MNDRKNIADYYVLDPDIDKKLAELEEEEDQLLVSLEAPQRMGEDVESSDLDSEEEEEAAHRSDLRSQNTFFANNRESSKRRKTSPPVVPIHWGGSWKCQGQASSG